MHFSQKYKLSAVFSKLTLLFTFAEHLNALYGRHVLIACLNQLASVSSASFYFNVEPIAFFREQSSWKMDVPSALYVLQN